MHPRTQDERADFTRQVGDRQSRQARQTPASRADRVRLLVVTGLATLFVATALGFSLAKRDALAYHPRDYAYLLSTTVKIFDTTLSDDVTLQPHGVNFLQFEGNDGHKHLLEGVHFEPNRVLQSALYRLYPHEVVLYVFYALVFVAPVLYVAAHHRARTFEASATIPLFALAWLLLPSSLEAATWDLRPYALLAPVFVLAILANHYRRPWWEAALLFLALLTVREEALMLGAVVIAHAALASRGEEPSSRRRRLLSMTVLWALWWPATLMYFAWTDYDPQLIPFIQGYFLTLKPKVVAGYALLAALAIALGLLVRLRPRVAREVISHPLTAYCLVFGPIAFLLAATLDFSSPIALVREIIFAPRSSLAWLSVLALAPLALDTVRHALVQRGVPLALGVVVVASLVLNAAHHQSALRRWPTYARDDDAQLVLGLRDRIDARVDVVLVDEAVYQAFWDYDLVRVYENLPWSIAQYEERWWPESAPHVVQLLREGVDFVVLRQDSRARVLALTEEAGVASQLRLLEENATYVAYAVER